MPNSPRALNRSTRNAQAAAAKSSVSLDTARHDADAEMSCDEVIDMMGAYLGKDLLSAAQRTQFCAHIQKCEACHDRLLSLELFLLFSDKSNGAMSQPRPAERVAVEE